MDQSAARKAYEDAEREYTAARDRLTALEEQTITARLAVDEANEKCMGTKRAWQAEGASADE